MAKRFKGPIKCVAYCHVGDKLVNMDDLTPEQKVQAANWLTTTYLNELYRGVAEFTIAPGQDTEAVTT